MHVTVTGPLGAEVGALRLGVQDPSVVSELRQLLADRGFVVLRGQQAGDAAFVDFLRSFGELTFTKGEHPVPGHPDLNVVSNVGRSAPPRSVFHVDTSYVSHPPAYSALRVVEVPARGGATLFTDQARAFETLPEAWRQRLAGRTIRHEVSGLDLGPDDERSAEHPALRPHPWSGRTALFLSNPERCTAVSDMEPSEAREVLAHLYAHSTDPANVTRHEWSIGDVVMWDNACVMHRADHDHVAGRRVLHRGMVAAASDGRSA